jgi:hypothetical protein
MPRVSNERRHACPFPELTAFIESVDHAADRSRSGVVTLTLT